MGRFYRLAGPGTSLPSRFQSFEMFDLRAAVDEELVVFGVVDGLLIVWSSEGFDCVPGVPEREQEEFALAVGDAAQRVDTAIARGLRVFFEPGLSKIFEVDVFVRFADRATPDA